MSPLDPLRHETSCALNSCGELAEPGFRLCLKHTREADTWHPHLRSGIYPEGIRGRQAWTYMMNTKASRERLGPPLWPLEIDIM